MSKIISYCVVGLITAFSLSAAFAGSDKAHPKSEKWPFDGPFGKFDRPSVQRGFQVYKEVCAACHGIKHVAFRNLESIGFSKEEVKAIASSYTIHDGPDSEGSMFERPGVPSDFFPSPFPNEQAARAANNNAYPPDLSLIIKGRENGANYVYSLLTGYSAVPAGFVLAENMNYNPYFAGGGSQIAMPQPLQPGQVTYSDGTEATIEQMSKDVVNFLQWTAEPEMEERKGLGFKTLAFLAVLTAIFIILKRKVWSDVKKGM